MDSWVRFSAQSQAKERIIRAAQYSCTLLGFALQRRDSRVELRRTMVQLESQLSLSRKLLHLGNWVEALEAAKRSIHLSDGVLRVCLTFSHLNRALYFACDNVLWASKAGLVSLDQHTWNLRAFRYYLFALILNLTRDVYELRLLMEREARLRASKAPPSSGSTPTPLADPSSSPPSPTLRAATFMWASLSRQLHLVAVVLHNNPPLLLDLLKNGCDVLVPLDRLGIYRTGPGLVGCCGLASSLLSILTILHPWLKLKP